MARAGVRQRGPATKRPVRRRRSGLVPWVIAVALAALGAAWWLSRGGEEPAAGPAFVGRDLHSLVVDPADPSRLFVGGHQAVAVSTDRGRAWSQVETLRDADAMGWAFLDGRILVAGHPGLSVSDDGGTTFVRRNGGLPATDIHALGGRGALVYAASPAAGLLVSSDAGETWEVLNDRVGFTFMGPILVDPNDPAHLVAADMGAGIVQTRDGGRTWEVLGGVRGGMWVTWDPADTAHLIASGTDGAAESTDGGRTWRRLDVPEGVSVVEMSPAAPDALFAAALDGTVARVWVSRDGGETWRPAAGASNAEGG